MADIPKIDRMKEDDLKQKIASYDAELQTLHERREKEIIKFEVLIQFITEARDKASKELFEMYGAIRGSVKEGD